MLIPKLIIVSLDKQVGSGRVVPCAPCWTLGLHGRHFGREAWVQKTSSHERATSSPLLAARPHGLAQPSLIKWYFPHTKEASGLILNRPTPPSFFPAREHNERGPCLNPKVGYHSNLVIPADQSLFNANQDNRSAL